MKMTFRTPARSRLGAIVTTIYAASVLAVGMEASAGSLGDAITDGKLLLNLRPRFEWVEQASKPHIADAFTLRSLLGWKTQPWYDISFTAEAIDVTHIGAQRFNDNAAITSPYPLVADPEHTDVNQFFIDYTGLERTTFRLGRQSIKLDNVRFIGNVEFRQVMQVFNAATVDYQAVAGLRVYAGYLFRQSTTAATERHTRTPIANVRYEFLPGETISAYGYWQDQPVTGQVTGFSDNSNRILGLRLEGGHPIGSDWKVLYTTEFAHQDAYSDGNALIDASYHHLGVGAQWQQVYLRLDQELLGSNQGRYGFQTPLGTNHLFQGWADQLLTTPKQGIQDNFVSLGAKIRSVALTGEYHRFKADYGSLNFGHELDVGISYVTPIKGLTTKVEYADYRRGDVATAKLDTKKIWLTAIYQY